MKRGTKLAVIGSVLLGISIGIQTTSSSSPEIGNEGAPDSSHISAQGPRTLTPTSPKTLVLKPAEGFDTRYGEFSNPLPADESYFPIGVWLAGILEPADVELDIEAGINTYVDLTADSNLQLALDRKMYVFSSSGSKSAHGFVSPDEADMWAGAGDGAWTGNYPGQGEICANSMERCGYTVLRQSAELAPEHQLLYANFGKMVTFWADNEAAARFVNEVPDIVSADNYWFTDPNICSSTEGGTKFSPPRTLTAAECRNAANYGWTIDRVQSLVKPLGSTPVWAFIEVGHPASASATPTITPAEIVSATWSSIIHGARGIIYFNHSFAGPCPSHNVMRTCGEEPRKTLSRLNSSISSMARVLNAPDVVEGVHVEGQIDYSIKYLDKKIYVLVTHGASGNGQFRIAVPCARNNSVARQGSDMELRLSNSSYSDTLPAQTPIATYTIDAGTCQTTKQTR